MGNSCPPTPKRHAEIESGKGGRGGGVGGGSEDEADRSKGNEGCRPYTEAAEQMPHHMMHDSMMQLVHPAWEPIERRNQMSCHMIQPVPLCDKATLHV